MSKAALALLAKSIEKDVEGVTWQNSSKDFRRDNLDYNKHYVAAFTVQDIENELRTQLILYDKTNDTDEFVKIDEVGGFQKAAKVYYDTLMGSFTAAETAVAANDPGIVAVVNNYDGLNKRRIMPADKAAKAVLAEIIGGTSPLLKNKLLSPDHTNPNADIRFTRALYNAVSAKNPELDTAERVVQGGKSVLDDLLNARYKGTQLITKETHDYFLNSFTTIASKYTNGLATKEFDITIGAEVVPRSQLDNEQVGGKLIKRYMAELAKAAAQIAGKTDWAGTASSDDYKTAVFKQLNNAVVKAGGTGKVQAIDSKSSTATQKGKLKYKQERNVVKLGSKTKPGSSKRTAKKPKASAYSLTNLLQYINARLPEAVRANMGKGGALVNRTGRLSESARIVSITPTKQGYPSMAYDYARTPYNVFDPVLGKAPWNTPGRDPKKLIEKSVRDVVRDMAIGRFYVRRI